MRVLIVKLTSMGDLVQALPALSDARQALPGIQFDWVVDEAFAEIPAWHPAVAGVIKTAHRRWRTGLSAAIGQGQLAAFWRQLRAVRYDAVIDAQSNIKSALVTRLARGPKLGLDKHSVREFPAHWAYQQHFPIAKQQLAIDRWRQLFAQALHYPLPNTAPDFSLATKAWQPVAVAATRPYLVAVANASWESKYWQDDHWRALIAKADAAGWDVALTSGSEKERARCQQIAEGLGNALVLPRHSLSEMAAILRQSQGAICMDTGLAHVAAALDVPTLTLYGPTDPNLIGATGTNARHLWATEYDCIPCYRRQCAVPGYRGGQAQCLKGLGAESVWQAFVQLKNSLG
jgi:heptosyltransferase-1